MMKLSKLKRDMCRGRYIYVAEYGVQGAEVKIKEKELRVILDAAEVRYNYIDMFNKELDNINEYNKGEELISLFSVAKEDAKLFEAMVYPYIYKRVNEEDLGIISLGEDKGLIRITTEGNKITVKIKGGLINTIYNWTMEHNPLKKIEILL